MTKHLMTGPAENWGVLFPLDLNDDGDAKDDS